MNDRTYVFQPAWPGTPFDIAKQAGEYWIDAWQRSVLFMDVLRQRGDDHAESVAQAAPHVLNFEFDVVLDGRDLERPVNYGLLKIRPPDGVEVDASRRPFIVFDPRAGHGPGIGGMKHDSEIGVVLRAGHPCYFVGFLPQPVHGQTIEDVCRAEARFIAKVAELHPDADGKPALIGNCQAGWQIMMTAALNPDLPGPLVLAGAPLSYWNGVHGKNPLRYLGGLLGGTWLTALSGDLGNGVFDGAHLVSNFESMNPANTWWKKEYKVYAQVDSEAQRFLEFEKWWGNPVLLNAPEMQYIADNLFVGNRLSSGSIHDSTGRRIDLRNVKSPIVVFCSWGDDITPPHQALGWVLDMYQDDEALAMSGQTIIYAMHETIGHLGIFVSATVANKEHEEFTSAMDLIDVLPPGLYEAVFLEKTPDTLNAALATGNYVMRFERRFLDDLRALGGNDAEDERRFAAVARVSDVNVGLYRTFVSPLLRGVMNDQSADMLRQLHPYRLRYRVYSSKNPLLHGIDKLADRVRAERRPAAPDNIFLAMQEAFSRQIVAALDQYRDMRDAAVERYFMNLYGSPVLQALVGLRADSQRVRQLGRDIARETVAASARAKLVEQAAVGGTVEAIVRALLYVFRAPELRAADERAYATLRELRAHSRAGQLMTLTHFKELVQQQAQILSWDEAAGFAALPALLPPEQDERARALDVVRQVASAAGALSGEAAERMERVARVFGTPAGAALNVAAAAAATPPAARLAHKEQL
ncbi:DUF3141 domain-containing protein [Massilia sp. Root418]|uniref:DUF3141 domain-containing protein n=1 Tax=Massilia sp. Root418 TaxID=1736532 RepID=UPI0009E9A097|nr:DUF3141 domain-containing protein [Massilia sp. Root418]